MREAADTLCFFRKRIISEGLRDGMLRNIPKRVRQHVNPLARQHQKPVQLDPNWVASHFAQPHQRCWVDLGCAGGKFALDLALADPTINVLGLEIRQPLVERANARRDELKLTNLHYIHSNANVDLCKVMTSLLPFGGVHVASVFFPDPWWKKKHQKRRVVTGELVDTLGSLMATDGVVLLQSDVLELTEDMRQKFSESEHFSDLHEGSDDNWMENSKLLIPTEREISVERRGLPVYRSTMLRPTHVLGSSTRYALMCSEHAEHSN
jgi:tRNA (guanine-N7-)-methyltransferase